VRDSRKRARRYGYRGEHFTGREWLALAEECGVACLRCGAVEDITVGHIVPLCLSDSNDIGKNGEFLGADFFHADVFAAAQEPAFRDTIKKCVNNVADGATPPTVCRPSLRPETTLAPSGPSGTVASGSGTFTFSTTEPDATFGCRVYEAGTTPGTFGACSGNGTHSVSGLGNGTYTFEVRAVEPFSGQMDLTPASRTWTVDPAAATAIAAPSNLTATVGGTTRRPQVSLKWTDNSNNEDNFVVERSEDNGTTWKVLTSSLAANTSSYTDKTVVRGGKTYTYRIKATKGAESSAYSNEASATTK
jgi:hypothetical protein